ncbi:MAG: biotin/lipoyl attachment protein [Rhizobacter sp.]|nr:biotin/lipoyl attachment protein [Rhizobacter sp.]
MNMIDTKSKSMAESDTARLDATQADALQVDAPQPHAMQPRHAMAIEPQPEQTLAEQISELSQWLAETDIGLLELRTAKGRIRLLRNAGTGLVDNDPIDVDSRGDHGELLASEDEPTAHVVASSVGAFLRNHPLCDAPLTSPGDQVAVGQIVGLLRIGALLLPVEAPCDGTVVDCLVADGTAVGYGTPLFTLTHD